jgi:TRAP-type mannitol/chloroaromatic compound transport system permease small subunit
MIAFQEAVTYLHATVFMLALGWTFKRNGHVRVDVFYRNFSVRTKAWINSLGILVFLLPFCVFLFFTSLDFVGLSWSISETSNESGGLPIVYLFKSLIPLMCVLLGLQALAELVRNACFLCYQERASDRPDGGSHD